MSLRWMICSPRVSLVTSATYRSNPAHLAQYSHDPCKFGSSCYRKDLFHLIQFSHHQGRSRSPSPSLSQQQQQGQQQQQQQQQSTTTTLPTPLSSSSHSAQLPLPHPTRSTPRIQVDEPLSDQDGMDDDIGTTTFMLFPLGSKRLRKRRYQTKA